MGGTPPIRRHADAADGDGSTWGTARLASPLLWGALATAGFYALVHYAPFDWPLVRRYFCGHPLEYVTTALYFVGTAMLVRKGLRLSVERAAFAHPFLEGLEEAAGEGRALLAGAARSTSARSASPHSTFDPPSSTSGHPFGGWGADVSARARTLERRAKELAGPCAGTYLVRRIRDACAFVVGRRSSAGLEDHLKYLAELAAEQLHGSYALVRTITWAVPILGFLGTVIGITMAIANLTPEQLDTSLGEVTAGLAVAFDTTALALALSLVLVFSSFLVERAEQQVLSRVEDYGLTRLALLFPEDSARPGESLMQAEQQAAAKLLEGTESLIAEQARLWQHSLEAMRRRWSESLESQSRQLDAALQEGMSGTLAQHAQLLAGLRSEFLQGLHAATEQFSAYARSLQQHAEAMQRLAGQEEQLLRLEDRLASNLEAVRTAEAFDQTLHNLTAAVHLLTARARSAA